MSTVWHLTHPGRWEAWAVRAGRLLTAPALGEEGLGVLGLPRGAGAALLVRPGAFARVNGEPVVGGLRLLGHRDEVLTAAGGHLVFSAESAPSVVTFRQPEGQRPPTCPVCRGVVRDGASAVECPGCGRWHHQPAEGGSGNEALACWAFAPNCRFCNHPTALQGEPAGGWRPDNEE